MRFSKAAGSVLEADCLSLSRQEGFQATNVISASSMVKTCGSNLKEWEGKPPETDSIKFKISSKTSRGKKDSTKRHHHRHHKRQPGEQQFLKQVVIG